MPLVVISIIRGLKPPLLCRAISCSTRRTSMFHGTGSVRKRSGQRGRWRRTLRAAAHDWQDVAINVVACIVQDAVSGEEEETMMTDVREEPTAEDAGSHQYSAPSLPSNLELASPPPWNPNTLLAPL
jgi:hypothetical protein